MSLCSPTCKASLGCQVGGSDAVGIARLHRAAGDDQLGSDFRVPRPARVVQGCRRAGMQCL